MVQWTGPPSTSLKYCAVVLKAAHACVVHVYVVSMSQSFIGIVVVLPWICLWVFISGGEKVPISSPYCSNTINNIYILIIDFLHCKNTHVAAIFRIVVAMSTQWRYHNQGDSVNSRFTIWLKMKELTSLLLLLTTHYPCCQHSQEGFC